jgi:hypothetical protein
VRDDCNAYKGKLRKLIADGKADAASELASSVLPMLVDAIEQTMVVRDDCNEGFADMAEGMQDHEDRLDALEADVGTTILMPEDADTFAKVCGALRSIVEELLAKGGQPPEGEAKLRETLALCTTAEAIIAQHTLPDEDEDEDEAEEGEELGEDGANAAGGQA